MSDRVADNATSLVRRLARHLNRKLSDVITILFNHKSAGSLGAVAGFAIAVVFVWKFLKSPPARQRRNPPKRRAPIRAADGDGFEAVQMLRESDASEAIDSPPQLTVRQIVRKKLGGCRKMTCELLGVILEEKSAEELQKHATVRLSVVEVLLEIAKHCDLYLMETILDDESAERVISALESAGLFQTGGLMKEKVLFCSTVNGRTSFVRQLEADWHIDSDLEIISQLSRFIRNQLYISAMEPGQIAPNVFTSSSLEQYFS